MTKAQKLWLKMNNWRHTIFEHTKKNYYFRHKNEIGPVYLIINKNTHEVSCTLPANTKIIAVTKILNELAHD